MSKKEIPKGFAHEVPKDIEKRLNSKEGLLAKWNKLTPLAQNEWICWVTMVKKQETREKHLFRMEEELLNDKRRPCCWPGCPHRNPKTKKYFKNIDS